MKRTNLLAVLVGLAVVAACGQEAFARARMYHPTLGRFTQRDPLGTPLEPASGPAARPTKTRSISSPQFTKRDSAKQYTDGMSLYQYVRSQSTQQTDPSGTRVQPNQIISPDEALRRANVIIVGRDEDRQLAALV